MLGFFKIFGRGVLTVVLLPFIALLLALYFAYCIIIFVYISIRSIIVFFAGGSPLGDLPEDVEAKRIIMEKEKTQNDAMLAMANMYRQQEVHLYTPQEVGVENTESNQGQANSTEELIEEEPFSTIDDKPMNEEENPDGWSN